MDRLHVTVTYQDKNGGTFEVTIMESIIRAIRRYAFNAMVAKTTGKATTSNQRPWADFESTAEEVK
jgi:hypothetical protein